MKVFEQAVRRVNNVIEEDLLFIRERGIEGL